MRPHPTSTLPMLIAAIAFLAAACTDGTPTSVTDASAPNFGHKPNHNPGGDGGDPPAGDPPITVTFLNEANSNVRSDNRGPYVDGECGVMATFNLQDARLVPDNRKIKPNDAGNCGGRDPRFVAFEFRSEDLVAGSPRREELEDTGVRAAHGFKVNEVELVTGTDQPRAAVVHGPGCAHSLRFSSNRTDQDGLNIAVNDVLVTYNDGNNTWTVRAEPPNDVAVCIPDEDRKDPPPRTYWHMPFEVTVALKN